MRQLVLVWLFAVGCGSSMHQATTPAELDREEEPTGDVAMRAEDVPAKVRLAAVSALAGAERISFVHTSAGQYEASAVIDGEDQEVTISPSGAVIDMDEVDDIDLTEDDDATSTAVAPSDSHEGDEEEALD